MNRILLTITIAFLFVINANSQVNFQWAEGVGNTSTDAGNSIVTDASGNVFITGFFGGTVDFDPGAGVTSFSAFGSDLDIFVCKFNSAGVLQWAKQFGGTLRDQGNDIALDASGNVYFTGTYIGTADFDPSVAVNNLTSSDAVNPSAFVCKLDPAGDLVWAKSIGEGGTTTSNSIAVDAIGDVYTTGNFLATSDFDPDAGVLNLTGSGIFISKLSTAGAFVYAKKVGGSGGAADVGSSIAVNGSGVYITGTYQGAADFDPGLLGTILPSFGLKDIFILKLDNTGNFFWCHGIGNTNDDFGDEVVVDPFGNVLVAGSFSGSIDFNPDPANFAVMSAAGSTRDGFVWKLLGSGMFFTAFDTSEGSASNINSVTMDVDGSGNIYLGTIYSGGTTDFDPGTGVFNMNAAGGDIAISKLDVSGNFMWAVRITSPGSDVVNAISANGGNSHITGSFLNTNVDFDPGPGTTLLSTAGGQDIFMQKMAAAPPPSITSFTPTSGPAGTTVTITGTDFGIALEYNTVS